MLILEYKLSANTVQHSAIDDAIRTVPFIPNKWVRLWMETPGTNDAAMQRYCAELAHAFPFAARLNSMARQASADRAWFSVARFYKNCREKKPGKKGDPQFQKDNRSVEYKTQAWKLAPDGRHITFTDGHGIGTVRLIGTRSIATYPLSQIKRVRILKRADGYDVQVAVQADRTIDHQPTGKQIGIDVGLKTFYTDSEGRQIANPRYLRKAETKLKRLHRRKDRKVKGSKNRKKAMKRLGKGYLTVNRQRKDFASKAARALVQSHDLVAYANLQIAHLVKNHRLAKSIRDAAGGQFLGWLRYYGAIANVLIIAVSPRFTSQDCSGCGERVRKSLSQRTHLCPRCGLVLDRDQNAARNILELALCTAGQAETGIRKSTNASGQGTSGRRMPVRSVKLAG